MERKLREFFVVASPTTLASLIVDIRDMGAGASAEALELERLALRELRSLVGEAEADQLIDQFSEGGAQC